MQHEESSMKHLLLPGWTIEAQYYQDVQIALRSLKLMQTAAATVLIALPEEIT